MKQLNITKIFCLVIVAIVFSIASQAQTFITWTANTGTTPHTWTGTYTGGTVTVTQGATGINIANKTPVLTNLNGATAAQAFATEGPYTNTPSRSLIFTFSSPVIINELNIADIDLQPMWNDAFTFSGVTFTSVTGANCNFTTTSAAPTGDFGISAEWARWTTSTTPVTSFTINYLITGGYLTHAVLNYSMKVTEVPTCTAGIAAPTLSATTATNVCPATTVNLTTITASNLPVGTTLTWHTGTPATTANKVTGTAVGAGTYYAAFFDATNNCYSGTAGAGTTAVTATVGACVTCNAGTAAPVLIKN